MRRRHFLGGCAGMMGMSLWGAPKGSIIELRRYQLRNNAGQQMQRTSEFVEKHAIAAGKRAGGEVAGVFANLVSPDGPFLLLVNQYASLAAMETAQEKMAQDKVFSQALANYYENSALGYERVEVTLLRSFDSMPRIEPAPVEKDKAARVFELRVYESNTPATLRRKVGMFESGGEIAIFRRVGIRPVFFGTALAGTRIPNLTYMVCYDSLADRERAWKAFAADPEWLKLRARPGLSDAEIVSNIGNTLLRPLPFSPIR